MEIKVFTRQGTGLRTMGHSGCRAAPYIRKAATSSVGAGLPITCDLARLAKVE